MTERRSGPGVPVPAPAGAAPDPTPVHVPELPAGVSLALVALGGAAGGLTRFGLVRALPEGGATLPWTTLSINVVGCFALGLLLTGWVRAGAAPAWVRPTLGTGFLGAFTTFSAVAVAVAELARDDDVVRAAVYLVASFVLGVLAAATGRAVGRRTAARRGHR